MPLSDGKYKIEEKEVDGIVKFYVQLNERTKEFESLFEAKTAIKTFKMGSVFAQHTGMEIFIEKE